MWTHNAADFRTGVLRSGSHLHQSLIRLDFSIQNRAMVLIRIKFAPDQPTPDSPEQENQSASVKIQHYNRGC